MDLIKSIFSKNYSNQENWIKRSKIISGDTHLFGKKRQLYCEDWPSNYKSAKGIKIKLENGQKLTDFTMCGIGTSILGYANKKIARNIFKTYLKGSLTTLNSNREIDLTEKLLEIHPWASKARYTRSGGEMAAVAVRMARAATGRTKILVHGYHGWHDWYLASAIKDNQALDNFLLPNIPISGVPKELIDTTVVLENLELGELQKKCISGEKPAALIIEIARKEVADRNTLLEIQKFCKKQKILLIFDEITSGFRSNLGGIHLKMKLEPDGVLYGKTISSGVPFSALVGSDNLMNGINDSFISSVYWTENIGVNAALETINLIEKKNPFDFIEESGRYFREQLNSICKEINLNVNPSKIPSLLTYSFDHENPDLVQTVFTQQMLKRNYLFSGRFYPTIHHNRNQINKFFKSFHEVCTSIKDIHNLDELESMLVGKIRSSKY